MSHFVLGLDIQTVQMPGLYLAKLLELDERPGHFAVLSRCAVVAAALSSSIFSMLVPDLFLSFGFRGQAIHPRLSSGAGLLRRSIVVPRIYLVNPVAIQGSTGATPISGEAMALAGCLCLLFRGDFNS